MMHKALNVAQHHWFYLVLPFLLSAALTFRTSYPWELDPKLGEAATIFDWCVFVPLIYAVCYRNMPRRALALRTLAVICGGIWIAAKIVPDQAETILKQLGWVRSLGIAVLVVFEGIAFVEVMRILFGGEPDAVALERQGIPPLLVKLMLAEARFRRWVWMRLKKHAVTAAPSRVGSPKCDRFQESPRRLAGGSQSGTIDRGRSCSYARLAVVHHRSRVIDATAPNQPHRDDRLAGFDRAVSVRLY